MFFVVLVLILVVVAPFVFVLYINNSESTGILWKRDINNFATGISAAYGKVYTIDIHGNINWYEAQTGDLINNGSIGAYWGQGVTASSNMVYGGKASVQVGAIKTSTGEFQWEVNYYRNSAWSKRAPTNIIVLEDRLFVKGDTFSVYNATTGKFLWKNDNNQFRLDANVSNPNTLTAWPTEGNRVFAIGYVRNVGYIVYRLDPDNGEVFWHQPFNRSVSGLPVVYENQVIIKNGTEEKTTLFSLDENSGDILWSYNVDARVFQPTAYSGLLFFGASDDSFYAVHLDNGTLAWKSTVDSQNITSLVNNDNPLEGLPIQIDSENQNIIGGFAVTTQTVTNETRPKDHYWEILCSLDLETGNVNWTKHFTGEGDISNEYSWYDYAFYDYALTENNIYLTTIYDFRIFSKITGNIIESQHFEHELSSPFAENGKVFVAADLWLMAYE